MKLDKKLVIRASLVFGWISIFWNVYDQLIQSINAYSFLMTPKTSGFILAIDNILGLFVLPIFGRLSDRCNSRYGRRTPFVFIGSVVALLGLLFVGIFASAKNFVPYIIALCITLFAMASYRSAGLSLVPDIVEEKNRSEANSIANILSAAFTVVGIVLTMTLMPLASAKEAKFIPITLGVVLSSAALMVAFFLTFKEKTAVADFEARMATLDDTAENSAEVSSVSGENMLRVVPVATDKKYALRNRIMMLLSLFFFYLAYNALTSNFTIYSDVILHFSTPQLPLVVVVVGALPGFFVAIKLSNTIGRKYTVVFGYMMMMIAFLLANFLTAPTPFIRILLYICFVLVGTGYGLAMVNMYPLYIELTEGKNIGQNTGIFAGVSTAAMVVTPILVGILIEEIGIKNGSSYIIEQVIGGVAEQTEMTGDYTVLLPYCAVALLCSIICALLIKGKNGPPAEKLGVELRD